MSFTIDINTILTALALAAILYVVRSVRTIETVQAVAAERDKAQDKALEEDRARITDVEMKAEKLEVDVARLKERAEFAAE